MVRAPCCQKEGLNKGAWSAEEDQALIHYIYRHGHANWRALPKLAGLLRCGKSCRLRWTNYLRPGIKRGNFSEEEEEAIITLHAQLGNKWSAIAAMLPGRTDNEIKNVWHTHLKKRLISPTQSSPSKELKMQNKGSDAVNLQQPASANATDSSSSSFHGGSDSGNNGAKDDSLTSSGFDESFWSETLLNDDDYTELTKLASPEAHNNGSEMEFWLNVFREAECLDN